MLATGKATAQLTRAQSGVDYIATLHVHIQVERIVFTELNIANV